MGRIWTAEERLKQADRIRNQKPWLKSTGPRSRSGKRISSGNAYKDGHYTTEMKQILLYLRLQKRYIATLRLLSKLGKVRCLDDDIIFENELNENPTKSIQNDTDGCDKIAYNNDNWPQKTRHQFPSWRVFKNFIERPETTRRQLSFSLPFS